MSAPQFDPESARDFDLKVIELASEGLAILLIVLAVLNASVETMVLSALCGGVSWATWLARRQVKSLHVNKSRVVMMLAGVTGCELVCIPAAIAFQSWVYAALAIGGIIPVVSLWILLVFAHGKPSS